MMDWRLVTSPCPGCGERSAVEVRQVLVVREPGTYSLAGAQDKVAAVMSWEYRCVRCLDSGPASPGDPAARIGGER